MRRAMTRTMRRALLLLWTAIACSAALAADGPTPPPQRDPGEAAHKYFGDIELVNQNGEPVRLYTDLLRGRVVVINTFFTQCDASCPLMAQNYAAMQEAFGERTGKDLLLISLSVDPETDTPARLAAYAKRFKARPGLVLVTGTKENVAQVLHKLGQTVNERTDHSNLLFIGNLRTGLWKKAFGLAPPQELIKVVQSVLDDRG